jgi:hypothetical protein
MHPEDRVLVAIMNKRDDFERLRDQGWYRIPVKHAPPSTAESDYRAFYFTKAFGEERWAIHWYAPVRGHEMVRRRDLLPDEPDHPRADAAYYKLQLGPLERLDPPIISLRWRCITFIPKEPVRTKFRNHTARASLFHGRVWCEGNPG